MNYRKGFIDTVKNLDDRLFRSRGLHINAVQSNTNEDKITITLTAGDGTRIAWIKTDLRGMSSKYPPVIELSYGWTEESFRRNVSKPRNGPGYGTILRALVCKAAKDAGFAGVQQTSSPITNRDKANAAAALNARKKLAAGNANANTKKKAAWRPVSSYIMNKLGFEQNENRFNHNQVYENRRLFFKYPNANNVLKNRPTPALNAIVSEILNKNRRQV